MSYLQGGHVNIALVQEQAQKQLLELLDKCEGPKVIIWDTTLSGPFGLIAKYGLLIKHDVVQMLALRSGNVTSINARHFIFITRPQLHLMDLINENVQSDKRLNPSAAKQREYHLIFVPNFSSICEKHLEHRRSRGSFATIEQFPCYLFPVENDVLSMELNGSFRDYHLDRDPTSLYLVAQALLQLQRLYGPIGTIWGKGHAAQTVWDLTKRLMLESGDIHNAGTSFIDQILLIDRSIDLITPLMTQLTYEGLIDELFGIKDNAAHFPIELFPDDAENRNDSSDKKTTKAIILNSADELYADLRDKNFNAVGSTLSKRAKVISIQFEERHGDKTVQEIKQFVEKLPNMLANKQSLTTHFTIAEAIKNVTDTSEFLDTLQTEQDFVNSIDTDKVCSFIEELIAQKASLVKVLRLICLQCATASGLKPKILDFYKRELVQVYGLDVLLTIINLEKSGLLYTQSTTRGYAVLRKSLHLTMEDTFETEPTDISYVHGVYAPLSVRLAENLCKPKGWKHLQDVLGLLPGPNIEDTQPTRYFAESQKNVLGSDSQIESPKVILVFFIGGCTFAEISALRFLTQQEDINYEFVVATTKLINGNTFIESLMQQPPTTSA